MLYKIRLINFKEYWQRYSFRIIVKRIEEEDNLILYSVLEEMSLDIENMP